MSTTPSSQETSAEHLLREDVPVFTNDGKRVEVVNVPPLKASPLLVPPAEETTHGRALQPNEALSSEMPLVLVRSAEHGKELVLPGYYACVGTMPCANTEYYLLVRWEHRESGRQGERRVTLPEHIRVIDQDALLPPPDTAFSTPAAALELSAALPGDMLHRVPELPPSTHTAGQPGNAQYPQLQHSAKRKSY
jgi:hypothetical protein